MSNKNIKHNFINGACTYCGMTIAEAKLKINRHTNGKMTCREGDEEPTPVITTARGISSSLSGMLNESTPDPARGMPSSLAEKISEKLGLTKNVTVASKSQKAPSDNLKNRYDAFSRRYTPTTGLSSSSTSKQGVSGNISKITPTTSHEAEGTGSYVINIMGDIATYTLFSSTTRTKTCSCLTALFDFLRLQLHS